MEGSSRRALTSNTSRGTSCYRAPELLLDTNPHYTNKVDMWAVGCILYELVLRQRAFREDWFIFTYAQLRQPFELLLGEDVVPDDRKRDFLVKIIKELLDVDPSKRPRARKLYERFISWGSDGVSTHNRAPMDAPGVTIPDSPKDLAVHEENGQSDYSSLSEELPKGNEEQPHTWGLPDSSKLPLDQSDGLFRIKARTTGSWRNDEADGLSDTEDINPLNLSRSSLAKSPRVELPEPGASNIKTDSRSYQEFVGADSPLNEFQDTLAEPSTVNPSRQLDSCTDFPVVATSVMSGIFLY